MLKNLKKKKNNKGFTLVELLVVIAIIGILAVVAVPSLFKQMDKAKATQVVANVNAIKTEIVSEFAIGKDEAAIVLKSSEIVKIVDNASKKANESYSVVARTGSGTGATSSEISIKVETTSASTVLLNAAKQMSAVNINGALIDTNDDITTFYIDITK